MITSLLFKHKIRILIKKMNITNYSLNSDVTTTTACDEIMNNYLYTIFAGYLVPLISPKIRNYCKEGLSTILRFGKIAGDLATLTEFGFEKVQDMKNNGEMVNFIQRVAKIKDFNVLSGQVIDLAWNFSGDTDKGNKDEIQQTWKKLLNELDRVNALNILDKTRIKSRSNP